MAMWQMAAGLERRCIADIYIVVSNKNELMAIFEKKDRWVPYMARYTKDGVLRVESEQLNDRIGVTDTV